MGRYRKASSATASTTVSTTSSIIVQKDWTTLYNGYGMVIWDASGVDFQPKAAVSPDETHAVMILKNATSVKDFTITLKAKTVKQLRQNSPANAWECFWIVFNYVPTSDGNKTANYALLKPNGVEMGTMDGTIGQQFLFTSSSPKLVLNTFNTYTLTKSGKQLKLVIDGVTIFDKVFDTLYDQAGTFGLYCEDAECLVESFEVK